MEVSVQVELSEEEILKEKSFENVLMKFLETIEEIKEKEEETK